MDEEIYIKPDVFFYLDGNIHVDGKLYEKLPLSKTINNCNGLVTEIQEQPGKRTFSISKLSHTNSFLFVYNSKTYLNVSIE